MARRPQPSRRARTGWARARNAPPTSSAPRVQPVRTWEPPASAQRAAAPRVRGRRPSTSLVSRRVEISAAAVYRVRPLRRIIGAARLALNASGAPARDEIALDGYEEDEGGDRDHHAGGHDEPPVHHRHVEEIVDPDGEGLQLVLADQHECEQEVVPRHDEREDGGGDDPGQREGRHHVPQGLRTIGSVDEGGVLQLYRDRLEEGAEDPERIG